MNVVKELVFANLEEVITAFQFGQVDLHASIKVRLADKIIDTTVGRVLLFEALPEGSRFSWVNKVIKKSDLTKLS